MCGTDGNVVDEAKPGRRILPAVMSRWSDRYERAFATFVQSARTQPWCARGRHASVDCFAHSSNGALNRIDGTRADYYHHTPTCSVPFKANEKKLRVTDQRSANRY